MKVDLSCPIELWEFELPTEEKPVCSLKFFNLGERPISSIQITVTCFDEKSEVLSRRVERPMALEAKGREPFPVAIDMDGLSVDAIDLTIDKAWFEDGNEWRRAQEARLVDYQPNELPPNRKLEQLRYVAGPDAVGYPSDQKNVWICVCGRVNAAEETTCRRCAREKAEVFDKFSPESVQEVIDRREHELEEKARLAREEASRQEFLRQEKSRRKKRKRRVRTAVISIVLVLAAASYLFVVLGLPELKYQTAMAAMASGDTVAARETFADLLDYRDSQLMVKECDLRTAMELMHSGNEAGVDAAILTLRALGAYPGAAEAIEEATYQKAVLLMDGKKYADASEVLAGIAGYRDADDLKNQADYRLAADTMQAGNYDAAATMFEALGTYMDAAAQAKECVYRPASSLMNGEQYDEAAAMFETIVGYRDATEMYMQCLYQSALAAQLSSDYDRAAELFSTLGTYEDSSEQMRRTIYLAAKTAMDAGEHEAAERMFASIPDYEDAKTLALECVYQPAVALMEDKKYEEAAALFEKVQGYKDADEMYGECLYQPAVALMDAEDYEGAVALLEKITGNEDAADLLSQARYKLAERLEADGELDEAIAAFEALGDYEDAAERVQKSKYVKAEEAFDAGQYAAASEQFEALGEYEDAAERVKACAYELAVLLFDGGELERAYEALTSIEGYAPATVKAGEAAYAMAEAYIEEKDLEAAVEAFALAGGYKDASERRLKSIYDLASGLMNDGQYPEASAMFDSIASYSDAADMRDLCYDLWLLDKAVLAEASYDEGDYQGVVDALRDLDMEKLPALFEDIANLYYDANLKLARQLINDSRQLEAYPYLLACKGYKNADDLLSKNIYKILGTWETDAGERYAFYLNGVCSLAGEERIFTMHSQNQYGIFTGESVDTLKRTHSYSSGNENTMTIREDETGKAIRLTRVKPAELSPTTATDSVANNGEDMTEQETDELIIGEQQ